jgi:hypothetical protein
LRLWLWERDALQPAGDVAEGNGLVIARNGWCGERGRHCDHLFSWEWEKGSAGYKIRGGIAVMTNACASLYVSP